ncbi:hypothetical protein F2Q69_00058735 [Brassica cretica]|uniref:CCHC-type domain-containing protein n=1 Tax=Brassica cretica TaxID=69181 RepID=A0A8S9RMR2_BRACR|nr:hypothetical protein F2Q69_00058735 [Brassica cretica]
MTMFVTYIPNPSPIFNVKIRDDLAHVEKIIGFFPSSSIKGAQPLRFSPETQNLAKPCPSEKRAAADHQTSTDHRVASPERRSRRVPVPSRHFLEYSTLFLLDPSTSEELLRYRERFGDQMREEPADGAQHQADARGNVPGVGVQHRIRLGRGKRTCKEHSVEGYLIKDCRFPPNVRCYRCNRVGHTSSACRMPAQGAPQQGAGRNEQLPPPLKRKDLSGRAFVVGDHEGGEPIVELLRYRERFGDQMREEPADGAQHQADARGDVPGVGELGLEEESELARSTQSKATKVGHTSSACRMPAQGAPQQGAGRKEQLPPPPKRQDLGGRAFVVGDHEGGEPIVGMFPIPT